MLEITSYDAKMQKILEITAKFDDVFDSIWEKLDVDVCDEGFINSILGDFIYEKSDMIAEYPYDYFQTAKLLIQVTNADTKILMNIKMSLKI